MLAIFMATRSGIELVQGRPGTLLIVSGLLVGCKGRRNIAGLSGTESLGLGRISQSYAW